MAPLKVDDGETAAKPVQLTNENMQETHILSMRAHQNVGFFYLVYCRVGGVDHRTSGKDDNDHIHVQLQP